MDDPQSKMASKSSMLRGNSFMFVLMMQTGFFFFTQFSSTLLIVHREGRFISAMWVQWAFCFLRDFDERSWSRKKEERKNKQDEVQSAKIGDLTCTIGFKETQFGSHVSSVFTPCEMSAFGGIPGPKTQTNTTADSQ